MASNLYLSVVIVVVIIIIAFFAWRYWKKHRGKDGFSYSTPATPRVREAVGGLFAALKHMVALGRSLELQAAQLGDATPVAGARLSASQMVKALDRAEKGLSGAPPTYANYLAIYRGLTSTDAALLAAADAYRMAGHQTHQLVVRSPSSDFAGLGSTLIAMSRQLRQVVASVHRLGVALDVE